MRHEKIDVTTGNAFAGQDTDLPRYTLAIALLAVRRVEGSASRGAVFREITEKNSLYNLVDWLYFRAGQRSGQPLLLLIYMLKCITSLGPINANNKSAVSITNFSNESRTIDRLAEMLPQVDILRLSLRRRHVFQRGQLAAVLRMIGSAKRIWSFLVRLAQAHSLMPAARMAGALAVYMRSAVLFAERPELKAAIVASNYSPEAVGLSAAAHCAGRRLVYFNHAPVPANSVAVLQVLADCAIFYGDATRQVYEKRARCTADVVLVGLSGEAQPMQWNDKLQQIGIFLTALTRVESVEQLLQSIRASHPDIRILIRNHPVALLQTDLSDLAAKYGGIEITLGTPLESEIAGCDLVFCGNSGVAVNVLRGGRPVAYSEYLDGLTFDYNGFVEAGLTCHAPHFSTGLYSKLRAFYSAPEWQGIMRNYDESYGVDQKAVEQAAARRIEYYLS